MKPSPASEASGLRKAVSALTKVPCGFGEDAPLPCQCGVSPDPSSCHLPSADGGLMLPKRKVLWVTRGFSHVPCGGRWGTTVCRSTAPSLPVTASQARTPGGAGLSPRGTELSRRRTYLSLPSCGPCPVPQPGRGSSPDAGVYFYFQAWSMYPHPAAPGKACESLGEAVAGGTVGGGQPAVLWVPLSRKHSLVPTHTPCLPRRPGSQTSPLPRLEQGSPGP